LRDRRRITTVQFRFQVGTAFFETLQSIALAHDHAKGDRAGEDRNNYNENVKCEMHVCTFDFI